MFHSDIDLLTLLPKWEVMAAENVKDTCYKDEG